MGTREAAKRAVVASLLAARFVLELSLLAAYAVWGFSLDGPRPLGWAVGVAAPALVAVLWGLVLSPRARLRASLPGRVAIEVLLFAGGALGLLAAGQAGWAAGLAAGEVVVLIGLLALGHPPGSDPWTGRRR